MSNGYSMWFAFSAFLGIVSCKCHVKADEYYGYFYTTCPD